MRLPLFIANRYLLAKKSHNLINIITWISILGISVGSFALIVVLSAFNGLEKVISSMNNRLTPDLQISAVKGKTIDLTAFPLDQLKDIQGVDYVIPTITEDALFRANDKQHIGQVKGVGLEYQKIGRLNEIVFGGSDLVLADEDEHYFAVPGAGVAWYLGINAYNPYAMVRIYVPKRGNASQMSLENSFNSDVVTVRSVFSTEQEQDEKLVLVPFDMLSDLLEYEDKATNVEVFTVPNADNNKVKKAVAAIIGADYSVKNQQEQQETLYKIMRSEKWAVYVILTFILILATFNVVGSLSMLMIDKRKDTEILKALGADNRLIHKIFMNEGLLISVAGGIIGLLLTELIIAPFAEQNLFQSAGFFVRNAVFGSLIPIDKYYIIGKCAAIVLVYMWNFFARKFILYRKSEN